MELQSIQASEVMQLARNFRARAAEAYDDMYHHLMMRTALELEQLASSLAVRGDTELVLIDDDGDD